MISGRPAWLFWKVDFSSFGRISIVSVCQDGLYRGSKAAVLLLEPPGRRSVQVNVTVWISKLLSARRTDGGELMQRAPAADMLNIVRCGRALR
jgi:hypothetical protein